MSNPASNPVKRRIATLRAQNNEYASRIAAIEFDRDEDAKSYAERIEALCNGIADNLTVIAKLEEE